jgi:hypothetical protein
MKKFTPLLTAALLASSCATYERCAEKYGGTTQTDTVIITRTLTVPVEVPMPADTLEVVVDCDSLAEQRRQSRYLSGSVSATGSRATVRVSTRPVLLRDTVALRDTVEVPVEVSVSLAKPEPTAWYQRLWSGYKNVAAVGFFIFVLIAIAKLFK